MIREVQLDGLIGPTHFFGGMSHGNVASEQSAGRISHPRAAALQGLEKMHAVHHLGITQLVMPPHPRPATHFLRAVGFEGDVASQVAAAARTSPELLPVVYSSSAMWAANAATCAASVDAKDNKVHLLPANLISNAHRALEAPFTTEALKRIFAGASFVHHAPLTANPWLSDEGAANHMRLTPKGGGQAVHVFVYGQSVHSSKPKKYPARQHDQASRAVARFLKLDESCCVFVQQQPEAIDAGAFHNDVVATSNDYLLLYHEQAFVDDAALVSELQKLGEYVCVKITSRNLSLEEAVKSYLFNSQILTRDDGQMVMLAPKECENSPAAKTMIERMIADNANPIAAVQYVDINQSMSNGGGPACLRLRVWLNDQERQQVHAGVVFSEALYQRLKTWVDAHYPEQLSGEDLKSPALPQKVAAALMELEEILQLKGLYDGWL